MSDLLPPRKALVQFAQTNEQHVLETSAPNWASLSTELKERGIEVPTEGNVLQVRGVTEGGAGNATPFEEITRNETPLPDQNFVLLVTPGKSGFGS